MRLFARIELGVAALGINAVRLEIMMRVINAPLNPVQVVGIITPLNFSTYVLDSTGQREFKSLLLGTKRKCIVGIGQNRIHEQLWINHTVPSQRSC